MSAESDEPAPRNPLRLVRTRKAEENPPPPPEPEVRKPSGLDSSEKAEPKPAQGIATGEATAAPTPSELPTAAEAKPTAHPPPETKAETSERRRLTLRRVAPQPAEEPTDHNPPPPLPRAGAKDSENTLEAPQHQPPPPPAVPPPDRDDEEELLEPPTPPQKRNRAAAPPPLKDTFESGPENINPAPTETGLQEETGPTPEVESAEGIRIATAEDESGSETDPEGEETSEAPKVPPPSSNELAAQRVRQIRNGILVAVALISVFVGGAYAIYWILIQDRPAQPEIAESESTPRVVEASPTTPLTSTPLHPAADEMEEILATEEPTEPAPNGERSVITAKSDEPTIAIIGRPLDEPDGLTGEGISTSDGTPVFTPQIPTPGGSSSGSSGLPSDRLRNPDITERMVTEYIAGLTIDGVRSSSNDPRATINGRQIYKDDIVNEAMGLRFTGAQDATLLFEDINGRVYRRRF